MYYNIALGIGMICLLILGAVCDYACKEIPDTIMVPFVIIGIMNGWYSERYIGIAISAAILGLMMLPQRKEHWLGKKLLRRAFHNDEDEICEKEQQINDVSDLFYEKNEHFFTVTGLIVFALSALSAFFLWIHEQTGYLFENVPDVWQSAAVNAALITALWCMLRLGRSEAKQHETLEPIGGADILAILGILSYWGFVPGLFGITVMFVLISFVIGTKFVIARINKSNVQRSIPLLPYLAVFSPAGILASITIGASMQSAYENLFFWIHFI